MESEGEEADGDTQREREKQDAGGMQHHSTNAPQTVTT